MAGTLVLLAALASGGATGCDDLSGRPVRFDVDWQSDIKPLINELISPGGRCTSCHNAGTPSGGLDLSDTLFDAIYKIVNSYVIPGEPRDSVLFEKINCDIPTFGSRMPPGGLPMGIEEQELFWDWIARGAPGDPPGDPIFRDFVFRNGAESLRW